MSSTQQSVLTIAGGVIGFVAGGPAGALYGAQIGYALGATTLSTTLPSTEGPRIDDLKAQISTYGAPLAKSWGTIGHNGTVIWSSDIEETSQEHRNESGGKGGGGGTTQTHTTYSYSASFAVAFHDGEIKAVRRVWANEYLIYDSSDISDYSGISANETTKWMVTKAVGLREDDGGIALYNGTATQDADPTIQSYEGIANTPAFRDTAYVVFTDLQLERFGNRIPQIRIEYVAVDEDITDSASVVRTIDMTSFQTGHEWNDCLFCVEEDMTMHFYTGNWDSSYTTNLGKYYKVFPDGNVSYQKRLSMAHTFPSNANDFDVVKSMSNIPVLFGHDKIGNVGKLIFPRGALEDGGTFGDQHLPTGIVLDYENYGVQSISMHGNNKSGYIGVWHAQTNTFRVVSYKKYIDVGILGTSERIKYRTTNVDLGHTGSVKAACISENYITSISTAGVIRRFTLDGQYVDTWSSGITLNADPGEGIFIDRVYEDKFYIRDSTNVYHFDSSTQTSKNYGSGFGTTRYDAQIPYVCNGLLILNEGTSIAIYSLEGISKTAESLDTVVSDLCLSAGLTASDFDVTALAGIEVSGFTKSRVSAPLKSIEQLMKIYQFSAYEDNHKILFKLRGEATDATVSSNHLGAGINQEKMELMPYERLDEQIAPLKVNVAYLDGTNEYDQGIQSVQRSAIYNTDQVLTVELPAVLGVDQARQVGEKIQSAVWTATENFKKICLPLRYLSLVPTDKIAINHNGIDYKIRVTSMNIGEHIEITGISEETSDYSSLIEANVADTSYKGVTYPGPSEFYLLDCPILRDQDSDGGFYVAAHGYFEDWSGCVLYAQGGDGGWSKSASILSPVTAGVVNDAVATGVSSVVDYETTLNVSLANGSLSSVTVQEMIENSSVNAAIIGRDQYWELIQFATATDNGNDNYTLSKLIRGKRGTEWCMSEHDEEEGIAFILIDSTSFRRVDAPDNDITNYKGVSIGSTFSQANQRQFYNRGVGRRPYAPVHLKATPELDGSYTITWNRRSRIHDNSDLATILPYGETVVEFSCLRQNAYRTSSFQAETVYSYSTSPEADATYNVFADPTDIITITQEGYIGSSPPAEIVIPEGFPKTFNPLTSHQSMVYTNGHLTINGTSNYQIAQTYRKVGNRKVYFEVTVDTVGALCYVGFIEENGGIGQYLGAEITGFSYRNNGYIYNNNTGSSFGDTYTTGDVIGVCIDGIDKKVWFSKNGVWQNSGDPENGFYEAFELDTNDIYPAVTPSSTTQMTINLGDSDFVYYNPPGFKAGL